MDLPAFYPILDTELLASRGLGTVAAAETILEAGARILQYRHKLFLSRDNFDEASKIAKLCSQAGALFVMNDRADMAMLLGSALHLGQDDLPPADARRLLPGAIIGFSTHNERQFREADREPVDYIAIGPMFPTASKRNPDPVVGVDALKRLRGLTGKPLVAIGGITRANAAAAWTAGADSVAVIADMIPEHCSKECLRQRTTEWLQLQKK